MRNDILKILEILIENPEEVDPLYIARSIRILKDEWPGLNEDEKKELTAVAHAVATLDPDLNDDDTYNDKKFPDYLEFESEDAKDATDDTNAEIEFLQKHDISSDLSREGDKFSGYYQEERNGGLKRLFNRNN